jgi:plasmid stability protein
MLQPNPRTEESMPTLHVRSVPDALYEQLRSLAHAEQRSLSAEVIDLLARAVEEEETRHQQAQLLATIRRRRYTPPRTAPDSTDLLREDRAR